MAYMPGYGVQPITGQQVCHQLMPIIGISSNCYLTLFKPGTLERLLNIIIVILRTKCSAIYND